MYKENNISKNTIKFSIWETKTDKSDTDAIKNSPEITEKLNFESDRKNS